MGTRIRSYTELSRLHSYEDRFRYLSLNGQVGVGTFGFDRYLNQRFYTSREWRQVRQEVIARDLGCDLGIEGYEIHQRITIHHLNPMTMHDITHDDDDILDPEYLITTTHQTHNAIHYGDESLLRKPLKDRSPGDTQLWSRRLQ